MLFLKSANNLNKPNCFKQNVKPFLKFNPCIHTEGDREAKRERERERGGGECVCVNKSINCR